MIGEHLSHGASAPATQRFDGVDALRGVSIISVVLLHAYLRLSFAERLIKPLLPAPLFRVVFRNAIDGVTVFFVISGFLITYTCLRRFGSLQAIDLRSFYRIRFARIAPLLLLVLLVLSVLHLAHTPDFHINPARTSLPHALFAALTFHLNWLEGKVGYLPPNWDVLWSLSVEEMFYVFFPLLCVVLLRWRSTRVLFGGVLLALIVMGPLARSIWYADREIWQEKSYLGGMDAIALGCCTAMLLHWCAQHRRLPDRILLAVAWSGVLLIGIMKWPWPLHWRVPLARSGVEDSLLMLGVCMILFGTVLRNRPGRRWSAPVRWFGRQSYEVYMTHEFVVVALTYLCLRFGPSDGRGLILWAVAMLLLSAPLGWLLARFFTEPVNRKLRRPWTALRNSL